jgi:pilus assembly protein CpaF
MTMKVKFPFGGGQFERGKALRTMNDVDQGNVDMLALEDHIHQRLTNDLERDMESGKQEEIPGVEKLQTRVQQLLDDETYILTQDQRRLLTEAIINRVIGLGPLEPLLKDPTITEIMVNDPFHVFIERGGRIEPVEVTFRDETHLRHVIDRIVAPIGRRIDESSPLVDARLPDGSRVNAIIPPLAIKGPALTIRKFGRDPFTLDKLVSLGTIDTSIAGFLQRSVRKRVSIIISGGTGSGKTTSLNALSLCIPEGERLITIEDSAELRLEHPDLISLESRPPNIEGKGEIPIRMLVRNALRMRPDRIIVGEVRGGEAFDMLQAMNTGHRGSLTTLHANSPSDALVRLESMVLMAGFDMPVSAIRRMITGAVEIVVQQDRLPDGRRVVTSICELVGKSADDPTLKPLFEYDPELGGHVSTTQLGD